MEATSNMQLAIQINPNIPGTSPSTTAGGWIGGFVINFYQFALLIAGLLALGAIVYGGVKYAASAGNPSAQSDGKEWILAAIYGLILLGAAYIILFTVNPNLVQLNPPQLAPVNIAAPSSTTPGGGSTACGGANPGTGPGGLQCGPGANGYFCAGPSNLNPPCSGSSNGLCPQGYTCGLTASGFICG